MKPSHRSSRHQDVRQPRRSGRRGGRAARRCPRTRRRPAVPAAGSARPRSRASSRAARSVWVRATTAPQCGRSASGSSAPLPQSMPYRCTSAQLMVQARARRRSCAAAGTGRLRGAPAAIRWPKVARSSDRGPLACCGRAGPRCRTGPAAACPAVRAARAAPGRSREQQRRGSAGSHGLCWRGHAAVARSAVPDRLDQHLQVGDLVFLGAACWPGAAARARPGPPSPAGPARAAGRWPPTAPGPAAADPAGLERHQRGMPEPDVRPAGRGLGDVRRRPGRRSRRRSRRRRSPAARSAGWCWPGSPATPRRRAAGWPGAGGCRATGPAGRC